MSNQIRITAGKVTAIAELNTSKTAGAVWNALPVSANANTWGDEIYFSIPVKSGPEDAKEIVNSGDLGYWPPGNAFCIFFGLTPMSRGNEIRPASPVNIIGSLIGDPTVFKAVDDGDIVSIVKVIPAP